MKIIDLSVSHCNDATEPFGPKIEHSDHSAGAHRLAKMAGIEASDFPDTMALATDFISGSAHAGTHIDAPYHYGPLCEGRPAKTVDQVPLEWCYGPGVVLDMRHKEAGAEITIEDMKHALGKIGYVLKRGDIVLLHTGCDKYWGTDTPTYLAMQSGLGISGLNWLLDQGIRCIGIDAWTLDRPVNAMVAAYKQTGDKNELWPTHIHGRRREYLQIEKLANLEMLPRPYGFTISALPVKLQGCTAGWCRAVAVFAD
ncbi:cyclase family protein [Anaeroselena agilis]|uniref:Cyclase family protein n=1 Tax=Anaeroselena agilis TaxID=3063788 RepID=A0ABU3P340_9FIRM|nr:cyclase family protein [Selenomonadales bacterium 4137-cl]